MEKHSSRKLAFLFSGVLMVSSAFGSYVYASRPKDVVVTIDEQTLELYTEAETIEEALAQAGYIDLEGAKSSIDLNSAVEDDMKVEIATLKKVDLSLAGKKTTVETHLNKVGDFLKEQNIVLDEDDTVSPARSTELTDAMSIVVDRYETKISTVQEAIPFKEVVQETEDLYFDQTELAQEGKEGLLELETKKVFKNGREISSELTRSEIVLEPVNRIVLQGTADYPEPEPVVEESYSSDYSYSVSGSEADAKYWIMMKESGGDPYATNGQYYGLFQLSDSLIQDGASPEEQSAVADSYVYGRYGSWQNAQAFWMANGWY